MADGEEIAIVGVGCRFPGADNVREYWNVLKNGENHVKEVPRDRWNVEAFYDADRNKPGKTYVRTAGFINSIEEWDHRFYGINDVEAELVDPQQRIVLDCVHMALEDGGITKQDIKGTQTGVYIGSMTDDYKGFVMDDSAKSSTYSVTGTQNSVISARVSYTYNLLGPSMTLDTACSSSLVAIDVASQALNTGKCSMCICGGVNILMDPQLFVALSKAGMLSPTGQCKTFTKDADGYARGEGCGIVILKSLKDAIKDGNKIWGTIKTGTNQDGHMTSPITAPSRLQQEKLIKHVFESFSVPMDRISVIEAHGTGTAIGDPTEVSALGTHFGKNANAQNEVFIGSVKTNIGHLEAAAGVAGLIKVLLMMKHEMIVPSLWYTMENENPLIKLSQHGFVVPMKCTYWKRIGYENRLACVNSFGFGGTNAHCIIEEYIHKTKPEHYTEPCLPFVITISAFSKESLLTNVQHFYDALKLQIYDMNDVSYTSTCKRDHRPYRKAIHGYSQDGIISATGAFLSNRENVFAPIDEKKIVFVFCGVGTSWKGMCSSLMNVKVFKDTVLEIDKLLKPLSGWMISSKLIDSYDILSYPMVSHIAIFACQIATAALWKNLGIFPDVVVGQSVGEIAAAYVAGYLDLQTAVKIIFYRSKLLAAVTSGTMTVVRNVEVEIVRKYCNTVGRVVIAVYNSPDSCTVSGTVEEIKTLKHHLLNIDDIRPQFIDLDVKCAYHSPHVDQAAKELEDHLHNIQICKAHTPMISTVTGKIETNGLFATSVYWGKNVRMPVLFSDAIKLAESKTEHNIFLEIGPSPVLRAHIEKIVDRRNSYTVISSMQKNEEIRTFTESLCKLFELGLTPKWSNICMNKGHITDIPTYQFRKFKSLYQSPSAMMKNQGIETTYAEHLYVKQLPQEEETFHFKAEISEETTPFVFQHIVTGSIILPGAAYADIGFEVGSSVFGLSKYKLLLSLEFLRTVRIEQGIKTFLHISTIAQTNEFLFHAKCNDVTMCKGWVKSIAEHNEPNKSFDIEGMKLSISNTGCKHMFEDEMYGNLESMGFKYGPYFTVMKACVTNGTECLTEVEFQDDIVCQFDLTTLHPCVLDGIMQSTINTTTEEILFKIRNEKLNFMPVAIGELRVFGKPEKKMFIFTRRINTTILECVLQVHYNILLLSKTGVVLADIRNYTTYGRRNASVAPCELKYRLTWHPLQNNTQQKNQPINVLFLTNVPSNYVCPELDEFGNIFVFQNDKNLPRDEFVSNAFKHGGISRKINAVVLFVQKYETDLNVNELSAPDIHECVRNNCMLLTAVVKFMTNGNITIPLYVVTQNTQPTFLNETCKINLVGEELWGFTRSIHLEFIHGDITLIDLQPSLKETKHTLISFIQDTCNRMKYTKPEIIISYDTIYGAQFTKVPRKEIIPTLRLENTISKTDQSSHKIFADCSKRFDSLILTKSQENEEISKNDHILIKIKSVCVHPLSIYPRTKSGIYLDQDIWKECLDDGHHLYCLEYVGFPIAAIGDKKKSCRRPEIDIVEKEDSFNKWEFLTIFPSVISTKMSVPRACTVNMKSIPFYQPGLILTTVLSWSLLKHVPKRSSVIVYSCQDSSISKRVLETLLRSQRNAILVDLPKHQDENERNIDVLITFEELDLTFPVLRRCKKIVCLQDSVSELLRLKVSRSGQQTLATFSATELLEEKIVSKCLPKVICWLQKNHKSFGITEQNCSQDENYNESYHSIEIMKDSKVILPIRNPIDRLFSKSAIYIVTGGMTGLGWELIRLLAEMGAGVIGSISRRDHSEDKADDIDNIEKATGCRIINVQGDVSDLESISAAIKTIESHFKQGHIRGIFHGAGVLNGKLLMNLEESELDFVLRPKVIGTMNMHIVTKGMDLDYFVVPSSINSLIGSPGQSSYGAANSFLDTFMEWRRQQGLSGQAINWGALCVGMASRPEFVESFTKRGFNLLSVPEIRSCFQDALMRNASNIIYTDINWDICAKDYTNQKLERTRLQMSVLIEQAVSHSMHFDNDGIDGMSFDVKALKNVGKERQMIALMQVIQKVSGKVIGGDTSQISMSTTFVEMAFDSMSNVTFINILHDLTGYRIPPAFMLNSNNTLNDVVQLLFSELFVNKKGHADHIEQNKTIEHNKTNITLEKEQGKNDRMTPIET